MSIHTYAARGDVGTPADVLARVRALGDMIDANALAGFDGTQISAEVIDALEQAEVFSIMAPAEVGGMEAHPLEVIDILRALSWHDGSTGWYCQAATTGPAVAGAFLGDRAIEAIFFANNKATVAGQAAPTGKAERVADGYRISGRFSFGSGVPNAQWIVGGYILHEDGAPKLRDGNPIMLIAVAPRARVDFDGNWDTLGLRGTGSYDFTVQDQVIHRDFAFDPATAQPLRGGALYQMGFMAIPALCHAAFAIGCGRRILDEWVLHARSKKRPFVGQVSNTMTFQRDLADAEGQFRSADAYVRTTFGNLFTATERGDVPADLKLDGRLCATNVINVGARIGQTAYLASATGALRNGSRLQRAFRDMLAANAHIMTGEQSYIDAGRYLAGVPGATPIL